MERAYAEEKASSRQVRAKENEKESEEGENIRRNGRMRARARARFGMDPPVASISFPADCTRLYVYIHAGGRALLPSLSVCSGQTASVACAPRFERRDAGADRNAAGALAAPRIYFVQSESISARDREIQIDADVYRTIFGSPGFQCYVQIALWR